MGSSSVTGLNPDAGKATLKSYGSLSTDHVTLNARFSPLWIATSHRLLDLTEDEIEFLYTLAEENCDLLELHVKRKVGLYFFVYPAIISGIFNLPQVAEAIKLSTGESVNIFTIYAIVFGIGGLLFMNFYGAKWKATELASCIKVGLARAKLLNAQRESAAT